jgi:hypothetical protein
MPRKHYTLIRNLGPLLQIRTAPCYCWDCNECRELLRRRLLDRAIGGQPTTFLTLTTNSDAYKDPDDAADALYHSFIHLIRAIRKRYPYAYIQYLYVWERTKKGYPHLHVLLRAPYIPQQWISDFMERRMRSPVVWIEAIRSSKKVAAYVSTYLGKEPYKFPGHRRWAQSAWYDMRTETYTTPDPAIEAGPWRRYPWTQDEATAIAHQLGLTTLEHANSTYADLQYWTQPTDDIGFLWLRPLVSGLRARARTDYAASLDGQTTVPRAP